MTEIIKYTKDVDIQELYKSYIDIEKFLQDCENSDMMDINWSYPPYDFNPNDVWNSYDKIKIIVYKIEFDQETLNHTFRNNELDFYLMKLARIKIKFMSEIYNQESDSARGLYFGLCNLCPRCTREFAMPCKMPHKMRYSIESLGGNVERMVKDFFDMEILLPKDGKLPEYLVFVGGLLYK